MNVLRIGSTIWMMIMVLHVSAQQEGIITYKETVRLALDGLEMLSEAERKQLESMPSSFARDLHLQFRKGEYIYKEAEGLGEGSLDMDEGDAMIHMIDGNESMAYYVDTKARYYIQEASIMGKKFAIKDTMKKLPWKLTNEKIKYLGYICHKATTVEDGQDVTVWFTSQIPHAIGPIGYNGLPGAVLMAKIGDEVEIAAQKVQFKKLETFEKPTPKKTITQEEYTQILTEKMKELEEMYGGEEGSIHIIKK